MRKIIVAVVLISLFVVLGFNIATRDRDAEGQAKAIAALTDGDKKTDTKTDAKSDAKSDAKGATKDNSTGKDGDKRPDEPEIKQETLKRPLRIVSRSWELLAPGVTANGGMAVTPKDTIYDKEGLKVEMSVVDSMKGVESALARGGDDATGADIALVSLPAFVASYERLRALKPQVFFVVARSYGREAVLSDKKSRDKVFTGGLSKRKELNIRGFPGEPATFLTLYALDTSGYPLEDVTIELPKADAKSVKSNPYDHWLKGRSHRFVSGKGNAKIGAFNRSLSALGKSKKLNQLVLSTADAQGLIPYVAIASRGFVDAHNSDLTSWASGWMKGVEAMQKDVPKGARLLAKQEGSPEILKILDLLGWVEFTSPRDNARIVGLSGRGTMDLKTLLAINWRIWKTAGVLSTPQPEDRLVRDDIIAEVIRNVPGATKAESTVLKKSKVNREKSKERVLIVHRVNGEFEPDVLIQKVGRLASVFPRSKIVLQLNEKYNVVPKAKRKKRKRSKDKDVAEVPVVKPLDVLIKTALASHNIAPLRLKGDVIKGSKSVAVIKVMAP